MKHSLKISSFIIFAAIVASVFTSCGNDSELFDEPVMYQTRAMTRASMRTEPEKRQYVTTDGPSEVFYNIRTKEAKIRVVFNWRRGLKSIVENEFNVNIHFVDENDETMYPIEYDDPYVYTYEIVEPLSMAPTDLSVTDGSFGEQYLTAKFHGKINEYRYHRYERKYDTIPHDINESITASESLKIRWMTESEFINSFNLINYTPISFETTDSLTIPNQ